MDVPDLQPGETWQQSVERRLKALDSKTPTLGDLPLAALQRKLENDWQPEGSILLLPGSVDATATIAAGPTGLAVSSFSAYRAAAQAVATAGLVNFDTDIFDVSGQLDTTTNVGRYTPGVAGIYRLSWQVLVSTAMGAGKAMQTYLRKNAALYASGNGMIYGGAFIGTFSGGSVLVTANGAGDFFDIRLDHDNGGNLALVAGAAPAYTYFQGELVGRI